jgi:hypothetical protein
MVGNLPRALMGLLSSLSDKQLACQACDAVKPALLRFEVDQQLTA